MLLIITDLNKNVEDIEVSFIFKLNEKFHQSKFNSPDIKSAEFYLRDCSHTLVSHGLYQLMTEIKKNSKSTSIDVQKKITLLGFYSKQLLGKRLGETVKFILKNKLSILYLVPEGQKDTLSKAHELIDFCNRINLIIQDDRKLLINTL